MMNEEEFDAAMDRVALARSERDTEIEAARQRFIKTVIDAYEGGLTMPDIRHATGLSETTLRGWFREHNVTVRGRSF